jgi:long-chain acyl-CoA synthetase
MYLYEKNSMNYLSPLEMFYKWEKEKPKEVYLSQPIEGVLHTWTWEEVGQEVRKMASYITSLNLPVSSKIGILSKNCAHWIMNDLAIMMSGHISVPLYPNLNAETLSTILKHSGTKVLFVGKLDNFSNMKDGIHDDIICVTYPFYSQNYPKWDEVIANQNQINENVIRHEMDLATIIYTSGTTGDPKGVMHKFRNFSFATTNAVNTLDLSKETFFSYLPLSHIAERLLVEMGSLYTGGKVSFAESLDTFSSDLSQASPSVFLGVPRIWTKFQQGILKKIPQKKLDFLLSIPLISFLIKHKIKKGLGLKNARNIFTGAAPTPISIIEWFKKIDITIQEAYAMTENTCYSHVSFKNKIKIGSVGQPLPLCDVKLSDNNEILIKHEALMDGYYKNKKETDRTISKGWLHTGDEGLIDSNNFLRITGRVKDIFKTSKGKYVAPSPIEMILSSNANIEQVCVVGNGLPQPIALIILSEEGEKKDTSILIQELKKILLTTNSSLNKHEQLSNIVVLFDEWTVENKLLTPTMKIKRNQLERIYKKSYLDWCDSDQIVIT